MSQPEVREEVAFAPDILQPLVDALPCRVESLNFLEGVPGDTAQNEFVVQREIAAMLKARLPCPTLVRQNEVLIRDERGACLPDVIVDRIGGGIWAVFELKLLLAGDRLCQSQVERDLDKLCRYKAKFPESHCIFLLVQSREAHGMCAQDSHALHGSVTKMGAVGHAIAEAIRRDSRYGIRLDAVSRYHTATYAMAWEIVHSGNESTESTDFYCFVARMNDRTQRRVGDVCGSGRRPT
ncbi:MAG TPA: hypothetical protein VL424_03740 [Pararobbsia sp.]|nr:hypothetical protein [Pararobbsia sp.]